MTLQLKKHQKPKFYDLYRDGVTQSFLNDWLLCPKIAEFKYVHGWTPFKESEGLKFGNCCHHVLERAYSRDTFPLAGNVKQWIQEYERLNTPDEAPLEVIEADEKIYAKAEAVLIPYFQRKTEDFDWDWTLAEETFSVESSRGFPIHGKFDGACWLPNKAKTGKELWLMDHKCLSVISDEDIKDVLPIDLQVMVYLWAFSKYKQAPQGLIYNIIRRPAHKVTKADNFNLDEYITRVNNIVCKDPDHFFKRVKVRIEPEEIDKWEKETFIPLLNDVIRWYESDYKWPAYITNKSFETKYGLSPYIKPIVYGDYTGFYQRDRIFPELELENAVTN